MILAITDWVAVTAIATVVLVIVTAVLAVAAIFAAFYAKDALGTARADLKTAQDQLEGSQRPLVVPSTISHPKIIAGRYVADNILVIPVENIGPGPALDITAEVGLLDIDGNPSTNRVTDLHSITAEVLAGAGASRPPAKLQCRASGWGEGASMRARLHYRDITGKGWRTTARFHGDPPEWREISAESDNHIELSAEPIVRVEPSDQLVS